ncbi:uncharacterized protein LOC110713417 [Chenopodium quinoa]|uniref:uncharacterized protein LOC110713417 n=1 Tax=Chenopodium quinoa TaxID=63459 RepID=UPI000B78F662|nr:uncharacterized protein LOC110713417 [Chenopodium quinoa]
MYVKVENTRLDFFRRNQQTIRADLYQGLLDTIDCGEECAENVGRRVILPETFMGGPRDLKKRYLNAMSLVQRFGKLDLFITMTCNPNWSEIKQELAGGEEAQNRPDVVSRVFRAKTKNCEETKSNSDGYPLYRRRATCDTVKVRGVEMDNSWVIPYNPYLLAYFNCHLNVEVCSTIKTVKYLYKYVYKGHDKISFNIVQTKDGVPMQDEIEQYQSGR